jgi:hippurate hydrolase
MALDDALSSDAAELAPELAELRHRLHRHPEIGLQLPWTQQALLAELDGLGLEISTGEA